MLHLRHSPILTTPTIHHSLTHFFVVSLVIKLLSNVLSIMCQSNSYNLMDTMLVEIHQKQKTKTVCEPVFVQGKLDLAGLHTLGV